MKNFLEVAPLPSVKFVNSTIPAPVQESVEMLRFMDGEAFEALACPSLEWLVQDVLPVGLVSGIVAQSGTGKTWMALCMMRNLATGSMWAGKYACKQSVCGFLDLEGNYTTLQTRWLMLNAGTPDELSAEVKRERIRFLSDLGQRNILNPEDCAAIITATISRGIKVLFIDSLSKTHLLDENSEEMKRVMNALEDIARRADCTVIVIHHAGKDKTRGARGSSAIKAALQHMIDMTGDENNEGLAKGVKLALTKAKSSPLIPFIATFSLEQVVNEFGDKIGLKPVYASDDVKVGTGKPSKIETVKTLILTRCNLNTKPAKTRAQVANFIVANTFDLNGESFTAGRQTIYSAIGELIADGTLKEQVGALQMTNITTGEVLE